MPDGGTLDIETRNVELDGDHEAAEVESRTGTAVCLAVTDTGGGMNEETRKNIFEPFFTTKGVKGTGLGLATVNAIVQQSQGWIGVSSEPGKGSTFRIYLPRVEGVADAIPAPPPAGAVRLQGSETILVVEDEEEVRAFVVRALAAHGYQVLHAPDGARALELAARHSGAIDVLLTDVVLPGMNGRELAERCRGVRPAIKVLFTSGYTQDLIANRGVLDQDVDYIPKPYTAGEIAAKVREVIQKV